jgi:hypothetical protein
MDTDKLKAECEKQQNQLELIAKCEWTAGIYWVLAESFIIQNGLWDQYIDYLATQAVNCLNSEDE